MCCPRFHSYPDCRDGSDESDLHCPNGVNLDPGTPLQPVLASCSEHTYLANNIPGRLSYRLVVVKGTTDAEPLRPQLAHRAGGDPVVAVLQALDTDEQRQRSMQRVAATYIEGRCIPRTLSPTVSPTPAPSVPPTLSPVGSEPTRSPTQFPTFCGPDIDAHRCHVLTTAEGAGSVSQACAENDDVRNYCASTCCTESHGPTAAPLDPSGPTPAPVTQAPVPPVTREPTSSPSFCHCDEAIDLVLIVDDGPVIVNDAMTTATRNQLIRDVAQAVIYHASGSPATSNGRAATSRVAVGSFSMEENTADPTPIGWTSAADPALHQQVGSLGFTEVPIRNTSLGIEWASSTLSSRSSPQNRAVVVILTRGRSTAGCHPGSTGCLPQPGQLEAAAPHTFAVGLSTSAGCNDGADGAGFSSEFDAINASTRCFESDNAADQLVEAVRFLACGICPTDAPTPSPTSDPSTSEPTEAPTSKPTAVPVPAPIANPTAGPTPAPTPAPSTASPVTRMPSPAPSTIPTTAPTTPAPTVPPQCLEGPDDIWPCTDPDVACQDNDIRLLCRQTCCTWAAVSGNGDNGWPGEDGADGEDGQVEPTVPPSSAEPESARPTHTPPTQAPTVVRCSKAVDLIFMLDESSTALGFLGDETRIAQWYDDPANYSGTNWVSMTQFVTSAASFFDFEDRCSDEAVDGSCDFSRVGVVTFSSPVDEESASARIQVKADLATDHESLSARLRGIAPAAGSQ